MEAFVQKIFLAAKKLCTQSLQQLPVVSAGGGGKRPTPHSCMKLHMHLSSARSKHGSPPSFARNLIPHTYVRMQQQARFIRTPQRVLLDRANHEEGSGPSDPRSPHLAPPGVGRGIRIGRLTPRRSNR